MRVRFLFTSFSAASQTLSPTYLKKLCLDLFQIWHGDGLHIIPHYQNQRNLIFILQFMLHDLKKEKFKTPTPKILLSCEKYFFSKIVCFVGYVECSNNCYSISLYLNSILRPQIANLLSYVGDIKNTFCSQNALKYVVIFRTI